MDERGGSRLTERAVCAAYRAGGGVATWLPLSVGGRLAQVAARAAAMALPRRRALVARHMERAYGAALDDAARRRVVRGAFESYARYWLEAFRLPAESPRSIAARMHMDGIEHLQDAHAAGQGVILAAPHLGGWDFGGAWLAVEGYKPLAVVERLEPPELFEWFASWRRDLGLDVVPAGPEAGTAVLEGLRRGRTVGLVSDRDIHGTGVAVTFFGEKTTLPAGPAVLALRTGAPLLPAAVYFDGAAGHRGVIRPPLDVAREGRFRDDVARITQRLADTLEEFIRVAPDQWHLMQPNWPSDPGWKPGQATR